MTIALIAALAWFFGVTTAVFAALVIDKISDHKKAQIQADQDAALTLLMCCRVIGADPRLVKSSEDVRHVWARAEKIMRDQP